LGAGCGIVSLVLARRHPDIVVYGVEIQAGLALAARINVIENKLDDRIKVFCEDMKHVKPSAFGGPVDMVVSNPPFGKVGAGRLGSDEIKMAAKHELFAELSDVVEASARVLKVSGSLAIVYSAERLADLLYCLRRAKLEPKWLKPIYPNENAEANRVVVKAVKYGRPGLLMKAPMLVHKPDGSYSEEALKMFEL
jgi:tRNA1Val (adenine37-N6)-methyltransferase